MTEDARRSRLNFRASVRDAFDFLCNEPYSLRIGDLGDRRIVYEGENVAVAVFHDRLSYELGVEIWRPSRPDEARTPFSLSDLMRVTEPETALSYRRFAAVTPDALRRGTRKLAADVRRFANPALRGEDEFFTRAKDDRDEAIEEFSRDSQDRRARQRAQEAWLQRKYSEVDDSYTSVRGKLSPSEQERLRIARDRREC